ncbi:hypothetical protein [Furfurilactobacillus rossiae]|uniref:Uncharacterized protein n=1 Tax=Furfurilactobacillus rossiae DSM 15814 TaxID=1114972 RepID=A0A0R1RP79_9LACO|nr:hypothetical protein [Furfurilactobacillus rossiae]KRL55829.1 hypothetical protein FD35_GL002361 [Furfurilactobacillus rossiae DSM 15814]QFR67224.1 hypothetical protein LR814_08970 [Furfurilactobacillus rossiae]QLE60149.1 hypothetical protein LROSRS0_0101 [Furfurilactobacillus rossiae]
MKKVYTYLSTDGSSASLEFNKFILNFFINHANVINLVIGFSAFDDVHYLSTEGKKDGFNTNLLSRADLVILEDSYIDANIAGLHELAKGLYKSTILLNRFGLTSGILDRGDLDLNFEYKDKRDLLKIMRRIVKENNLNS